MHIFTSFFFFPFAGLHKLIKVEGCICMVKSLSLCLGWVFSGWMVHFPGSPMVTILQGITFRLDCLRIYTHSISLQYSTFLQTIHSSFFAFNRIVTNPRSGSKITNQTKKSFFSDVQWIVLLTVKCHLGLNGTKRAVVAEEDNSTWQDQGKIKNNSTWLDQGKSFQGVYCVGHNSTWQDQGKPSTRCVGHNSTWQDQYCK